MIWLHGHVVNKRRGVAAANLVAKQRECSTSNAPKRCARLLVAFNIHANFVFLKVIVEV